MKKKLIPVLTMLLCLTMLSTALVSAKPVTRTVQDAPLLMDEAEPDLSLLDNDPGTLTYTYAEDGSTVTISYVVNGEKVSYTVPNNVNYVSGGYAAIDDLNRTLYTSTEVGSYGSTGEKYVGLFYFLWHGEHGDSGIFDLQKIIDEKGVEIAGSISQSGAYGPQGAMHWFAEPLYGYYYANDSWVHRKHMELLANANVDFLYFDVTNGYYYLNNALSVMKICHELNEQGYDAPQVVFYTHSSSGNVVRGLFNDIYSKGLYEDTWFYVDGKPCIVAEYTDNIDDFFTIKQAQWPNEGVRAGGNSWPWMDFTWPQRIFKDAEGNPSAISVSIAQHSGNTVFSSSALYGYEANRGRSFNASKSVSKTWKQYREAIAKNPDLVLQGLNFQAQWDRAIEADVPYVLVTGWNEWVAQRQNGAQILGDADKVAFIDTGSMEFSRDAEMMRGGYFDNYYIQLCYNIQKLKGTAPVVVQDGRMPIDVNGDFAQWDKITVTYQDPMGDTVDRKGQGFGHSTYTNTTGRNDIVASKVAVDTKNVYFYVECAEDIVVSDTESSWMQLFINTDNAATGWYGYDYIVNFMSQDDKTTTVAKYIGTDNAYDFAITAKVSYKLEGNKMMISVPQTALGMEENKYREIDFQFKWVDSDSTIDSMELCYTDGDCAPLGRLNYIFQNYIPGVSEVRYPEFETEPETEAPTDPETESVTEAPTEVPTEAPTDTATETSGETGSETTAVSDSGCSSVIASGAVASAIALLAGAFISLRRKH